MGYFLKAITLLPMRMVQQTPSHSGEGMVLQIQPETAYAATGSA
jgi:hypothetical protein